jgi:hypothetical protein
MKSRLREHGYVVAAACSGLCLLISVLPGVAVAAGPLVWSAPVKVSSSALPYVSCTQANLCVAAASAKGVVVASTNPLGGASAWKSSSLPGEPNPNGLSCSPAGLCVELGRDPEQFGQVALVSNDPVGGASTWSIEGIPNAPSEGLDGVSCPSSQLCVAVGVATYVLASTAPGSGEHAWSSWSAPSPILGGQPLVGVSCPTTTFCAAVDNGFSLLTSANPTGGEGAWTVTAVGNPTTTVRGLSCPTASFCAAVSEAGSVVVWTHPATEGKPQLREVLAPYPGLSGISCSAGGFCVAVGALGDAFTSTDPAGGARTWKKTDIDHHTRLVSVSCASVSLCVATDANGKVIVGHVPRQSPKRKRAAKASVDNSDAHGRFGQWRSEGPRAAL